MESFGKSKTNPPKITSLHTGVCKDVRFEIIISVNNQ